LQLEVAAHPPQFAVQSLTLTALAGQSSKVQLGLFAPQTPEPSRLDVTIARLKAIAGEDRVGSPVLEDTHRPGSFRMENFTVLPPGNIRKSVSPNVSKSDRASYEIEPPARTRMALRRIRPPAVVRVELCELRPAFVFDREQSFQVAAAYGPWRSSGCWWSTDPWNIEEWDVLAESSSGSSLACLLVHNCTQNQWQLEAFYD
jgi:protein ImuB